MIGIFKTKNIKRIISSILITSLLCLSLSIIIWNGKYFQNRLKSPYEIHKKSMLIGWYLMFAYSGICLFYLWKTNSDEKNYLFLFAMHFFTFAVYLISVYCFAAYILASISSFLSLIFSVRLVVLLCKNKQYVLMLMMSGIAVVQLCCAFCGTIYSSLEYGIWKN